MKRKPLYPALVLFGLALLVATALVSGCAARMRAPGIVEAEKEEGRLVQATVVVEREVAAEAAPTQAPPVPAEGGRAGDSDSLPLASPYRIGRLIIKNGEMRLEVEDTAVGVDQVTQVAIDTFGYILSSRSWYRDGFQYATITLGVPSDQYEQAMRRLRAIATRVLDEQASGTDVSDEYVDLESRLRNLEATEVRIRSFLDKATTVEESLKVNQQLSAITEQIEEVKGRMNYLKDRAAYSTITVHLEPQMPIPTPTPTAIPTPTPAPDVWHPSETFNSAASVLGNILRVVADAAIWIGVVLGPFLVLGAAIVWLSLRLARKVRNSE